jgi:hypothetical protein
MFDTITLQTVAAAEGPVYRGGAQFTEVPNLSVGLHVCN